MEVEERTLDDNNLHESTAIAVTLSLFTEEELLDFRMAAQTFGTLNPVAACYEKAKAGHLIDHMNRIVRIEEALEASAAAMERFREKES